MLQWEEKQVSIQRRRRPRPKRMWKWRRWMVCRVRKIVQGGVRPKRQEKMLMKKRKVNKDIQRRRMEEKMRREEKRSLKREIKKADGEKGSGSRQDDKQRKECGQGAGGRRRWRDEDNEELRYCAKLTLGVVVEWGLNRLTMLDMLIGIQDECGEVLGCRIKGERYEVTMRHEEGKDKLLEGLRIKGGQGGRVVGKGSDGVLHDADILRKLREWGVEAVSPIKRRFVKETRPGTRMWGVGTLCSGLWGTERAGEREGGIRRKGETHWDERCVGDVRKEWMGDVFVNN
ncbi:hypothetical protein F7725_001631 [Dissostichus mawsoni]|uniref:Uncharacterized protein n=1 Tax=Dissostichus mawsoni TaxID=36200 RepID=A0A7J5Y061_DISMA|nr:hypothetical protein F7725_001631 [Dissostichus mawsoni]